MKVFVQDRQCIADIALQVCGSLEAALVIAERNGLSITDDLVVGQVLDYDLTDVLNKQVVSVYKVDGVIPASMVHDTLTEELKTVVGEDTGMEDIQGAADPTKIPIFTNVFTKQFNIQFA
jgi:hypothetical protein